MKIKSRPKAGHDLFRFKSNVVNNVQAVLAKFGQELMTMVLGAPLRNYFQRPSMRLSHDFCFCRLAKKGAASTMVIGYRFCTVGIIVVNPAHDLLGRLALTVATRIQRQIFF